MLVTGCAGTAWSLVAVHPYAAAVINERQSLSIGGTPGQRVFLTLFGLVFTAMATVFVLLPVLGAGLLDRVLGNGTDFGCVTSGDLPSGELPPGFADCASSDSIFSVDAITSGVGLIGLCGVPFVLVGLYMVLRALRTAAWLEGTLLGVRGAFGSRIVDLSTAEVSASVTTHQRGEHEPGPRTLHRRQELVARDPASGRRVVLPLSGVGMANLPPHELRALADAITSGRPTDDRNADVHNLANQLRSMASNPLGL